jgi:predicted MFS family arabinose efflux permease
LFGTVWSRPGYRRLWSARTVSSWGDAFATVALSLLVLDRTGSGLGVSGVVAAEIVPVLTLAPIAGVVVDRWSPLRVMVAADVARMALAALLPLVDGSVPAIYAVAFCMSGAAVFFNPAAGATLPALVTEDELVSANSAIWTAAVVSQVVLAPAAGVLVMTAGYGPALWINAASFLGSAALLTRVRLHETGRETAPPGRAQRPGQATQGSWWSSIRQGAVLVASDRLLRALAEGQLLAALSAGATSALLVVLVREHIGLGSRGYGLALAAIGVGAALGPLLLRRVRDPRRPAFVFGPYVVRALVDLVLALVRVPAAALGSLIGYGIGTSTGAVTFNSLLQAHAPANARGRVFAAFDLLCNSDASRLSSSAACWPIPQASPRCTSPAPYCSLQPPRSVGETSTRSTRPDALRALHDRRSEPARAARKSTRAENANSADHQNSIPHILRVPVNVSLAARSGVTFVGSRITACGSVG